jgi:hypothetical protein
VRQIVHLKLSTEFPPEVQEAAVLRDEEGQCSALLKIKRSEGTIDLILPFAPCADLDPALMAAGNDKDLVERLYEPAYQRLMDALRQLSRSME